MNNAGFCWLRFGFPRVQFCAEPSREQAQSLSLISQRGFALRQALPSLSLSGSDRTRNMTRSALPPRREQIALPKAPQASDEAPDVRPPSSRHTNARTKPVPWRVFCAWILRPLSKKPEERYSQADSSNNFASWLRHECAYEGDSR